MDTSDTHDTLAMPATPASLDMSDMSGVSGVSWVTVVEAAARLGLSDRQVRRYVKTGTLSSTRIRGPRGPELRIDAARVDDLHHHLTAVEGGTTARTLDTPDTPYASDASVPVRSAGAGDLATVIAHASAPLVATIERQGATIQQQAEELGMLRERLRALEAPQAPTAARPAPVAPAPTPPPTARPAPSWRLRALRWWRG